MSKVFNKIVAMMLAILLFCTQSMPISFAETDVDTNLENAEIVPDSVPGITILSQPVSVEPENNVAEFKVEATTSFEGSRISYQWQRLPDITYETEEERDDAWENIPDATINVLSFDEEALNSGAYDSMLFRCVLSAELEGLFYSVITDEVAILNVHQQDLNTQTTISDTGTTTMSEDIQQPETIHSEDSDDTVNFQEKVTDTDEITEGASSDAADKDDSMSISFSDETTDDTINEEPVIDGNQNYSFTIRFNKNNSSASGTMSSLSGSTEEQSALPDCAFHLTGRKLAFWADSADGSGKTYVPGTPINELIEYDGQSITLYAIWQEITYTVSFIVDGETVSSANLNYTEKLPVTNLNITKPGYHVKE